VACFDPASGLFSKRLAYFGQHRGFGYWPVLTPWWPVLNYAVACFGIAVSLAHFHLCEQERFRLPNGCTHSKGNIMYGDSNHLSSRTVFLICMAVTVGAFATYLAIFGIMVG
jgi:hypothetical protein